MMKHILILVIFVGNLQQKWVSGTPQVPCFFIFGDSLSDSGNNNKLMTFAKANFLPYGVDFPDGPTGRFTNGKTTVDLIGDELGLEGYIKAYSSVGEEEIMKGVNYASGSAGIRVETGYQVGERISMDEQLRNHKEVVGKIRTSIGQNKSMDHLNKCLYSVYVGSNDWMLNYFAGFAAFSSTPNDFAHALITQLSTQLNTLYDLGARKIILFGLGPLGCLPMLNQQGICSKYINDIMDMYNTKLRSLTYSLNNKYGNTKFIWINTLGIVSPNNLQGLGLKLTNIPCCGMLQALCSPLTIPCNNRTDYAYWDNAHPTEAANKVLAQRAYTTHNPSDAYPMDIRTLAML